MQAKLIDCTDPEPVEPVACQESVAAPTPASCCPICGGDEAEDWLTGFDRFEGAAVPYHLVRCSVCAMVWVSNPPLPSQMGQHYTDRYYRLVTWAGDASKERWRNHALTVKRYKQAGSLLDIGCSSGAFLASMKGEGWKLCGVEISPASAEKARMASGADVFTGNVLDAPFSPGSFDVVTSFDVLEHLYQPRETMAMIGQWLKPGGIFYVVLPNIESWEARLFRSWWFGLELPRHLSHFSPRSLRYLSNLVGLQEESLKTPAWTYIEYSAGYLCRDILGGWGFSRPALADPSRPGLLWRLGRKALRLTVLSAWAQSASFAGVGPGIEAIFRKPSTPSLSPEEVIGTANFLQKNHAPVDSKKAGNP